MTTDLTDNIEVIDMDLVEAVTTPVSKPKRKRVSGGAPLKKAKNTADVTEEAVEVTVDVETIDDDIITMESTPSNIPSTFIYDESEYTSLKKIINPAKVTVKKMNGENKFITPLGHILSQIIGLRVGGELVGGYANAISVVIAIFVNNHKTAFNEFFPLISAARNFTLRDYYDLYEEFAKAGHFERSPSLYKFMRALLWSLDNIVAQFNAAQDNTGNLFRGETPVLVSQDLYSGIVHALGEDGGKSINYISLGGIVDRSFTTGGGLSMFREDKVLTIKQYNDAQLNKSDLRNRVSIVPDSEGSPVEVVFRNETKELNAQDFSVVISKDTMAVITAQSRMTLKID